jgi:hypothetical protein
MDLGLWWMKPLWLWSHRQLQSRLLQKVWFSLCNLFASEQLLLTHAVISSSAPLYACSNSLCLLLSCMLVRLVSLWADVWVWVCSYCDYKVVNGDTAIFMHVLHAHHVYPFKVYTILYKSFCPAFRHIHLKWNFALSHAQWITCFLDCKSTLFFTKVSEHIHLKRNFSLSHAQQKHPESLVFLIACHGKRLCAHKDLSACFKSSNLKPKYSDCLAVTAFV